LHFLKSVAQSVAVKKMLFFRVTGYCQSGNESTSKRTPAKAKNKSKKDEAKAFHCCFDPSVLIFG